MASIQLKNNDSLTIGQYVLSKERALTISPLSSSHFNSLRASADFPERRSISGSEPYLMNVLKTNKTNSTGFETTATGLILAQLSSNICSNGKRWLLTKLSPVNRMVKRWR